MRIEPGDLLFGDREGVLVVPRAAEKDVIDGALTKAQTEGEVSKAIKSGMGACEAWEKFGVF